MMFERFRDGVVIETSEVEVAPSPLDTFGVMATLNVVLGVWSLTDAAHVSGQDPEALIAEAQAWEFVAAVAG